MPYHGGTDGGIEPPPQDEPRFEVRTGAPLACNNEMAAEFRNHSAFSGQSPRLVFLFVVFVCIFVFHKTNPIVFFSSL